MIGLLIALSLRYRARAGEEREGSIRPGRVPEERGSLVMALVLAATVAGILFTITLGTFSTVDLIEKPPVGSTLHIQAIAYQWGWSSGTRTDWCLLVS